MSKREYFTRAKLARKVELAAETVGRTLILESADTPEHRIVERRHGRLAPLTEYMEGRFVNLWLQGFMSAATGNGRLRRGQ